MNGMWVLTTAKGTPGAIPVGEKIPAGYDACVDVDGKLKTKCATATATTPVTNTGAPDPNATTKPQTMFKANADLKAGSKAELKGDLIVPVTTGGVQVG